MIRTNLRKNYLIIRGILLLLFLIATGAVYSQAPQLLPVDAPNNQYPITFTDNAQKIIVIQFDQPITTLGTTAGWSVTVGGSPATIVSGPTGFGPYVSFTLQNSISYD